MNYEGFYYLEIGVQEEIEDRSLVWGVKILEEKSKNIWGYFIFQDLLEERQRIMPLLEEPKIIDNRIECTNDIGNTFRFMDLQQKAYLKKARKSFIMTPEGELGN